MGTLPIHELLETLRQMLQTFRGAYIVLDALNECTDQEALFDLLTTTRSWKMESVCFLITSRDEPDIRNNLDPAEEKEVLLQESTVDEISLYRSEAAGIRICLLK